MRKIIFTIFLTVSIATASDAQVRVGPFLGYGERLGLWGLGAYTELVFNDRISVSPNFTQYFPKDLDNAPRRTAWEVNANLNYYVIRGEVGYLYGIAGLNYTNLKVRTTTLALTEEVDNSGNAGLNLGLGTMVRVTDRLFPFAESKYAVGGYSQLTLIFGVKFQLGEGTTLEDDY
jgi:outer membrane immunogenic protein